MVTPLLIRLFEASLDRAESVNSSISQSISLPVSQSLSQGCNLVFKLLVLCVRNGKPSELGVLTARPFFFLWHAMLANVLCMGCHTLLPCTRCRPCSLLPEVRFIDAHKTTSSPRSSKHGSQKPYACLPHTEHFDFNLQL